MAECTFVPKTKKSLARFSQALTLDPPEPCHATIMALVLVCLFVCVCVCVCVFMVYLFAKRRPTFVLMLPLDHASCLEFCAFEFRISGGSWQRQKMPQSGLRTVFLVALCHCGAFEAQRGVRASGRCLGKAEAGQGALLRYPALIKQS